MDRKLVSWARAVKARQRHSKAALPPLWLFTDPIRTPDSIAAVSRLPKAIAGVILRDAGQGRIARAKRIAQLCRARHLGFSIAGDIKLAVRLQAGLHMRAGRLPLGPKPRFLTSSAHSFAECQRARRSGARLIFLSPVFDTASHPGLRPLGIVRWTAVARRFGPVVAALGGISGPSAQCLPRWCHHAGAIGAFTLADRHLT